MVAAALALESLAHVTLLSVLAVETSLKTYLLVLQSCSFFSSLAQVQVADVVSFRSFLQVVVLVFGNFLEFLGTLLQFEQVVLSCLDTLIGLAVLALFHAVGLAESVDFLLVTVTLFFEFLVFELSSVDIFAQGERVVRLCLHFTLETENFSFTALDLLTECGDLNLHVIVAT